MTINRNNFEAYLLDYLEGNLDPLLTADLMAFLAENPEFEKYIPDFEIQPLLAQSAEFNYKQMLRKDFSDIPEITSENFDEFCIAYCEGLLGEKESLRLETYIAQHKEKQKDLDLFRALKLQPDLSITYTGKANLKKPAGHSFRMRYIYLGLSIAASVVLILLFTLNRKSNYHQEITLTERVTRSNPVSSPLENDSLPQSENIPLIESRNTEKQDVPHIEKNTAEVKIQSLGEAPILKREDLQLTALKPIISELPLAELRREIVFPKTNIALSDPEPTQKRTFPEWIDSESLLGTLISKVDFWKTAETAIEGFNYLTEAQLSISKNTDANGNTRGLILNTESYSIETK